ncbi:MAG TPA: quinolinate synthase NadA [Bacteroidales bacterium]|jgi:quinolinate synthase|nr:quinolinate synthase NadA [Bacteroidales bacterium]HNZ43175.1 quinolinate synthase NadA [Bacteroidales bacterium]HPB25442.1 quinolinate synthase NadA [Bacteroidales bacterium]HPI30642.1 quinolinate synthase NadA [Bacteroidales bacterium]HQN16688.1 quinolinate synthase NadA [Bacteroidales bacterium]
MNYQKEILALKEQKNAVILAHFYQIPEIQDLADYVEDSLGLSQKAADTNAKIIVFCGVKFMAETAKILNPDKKVLLPDMEAGCSLADSCSYEDFKKFIKKHPGHKVVSYINCSAEVKTLSDIICTSGNAVNIINSIPKDQPVIFAPDKNLGGYINKLTGRNMVLWNGSCKVHEQLTQEEIIRLKIKNPDAKLIAHPECQAVILELADFIGSTAAMLKFIEKDNNTKYIVATETGIIHQMKKVAPKKEFIVAGINETCSCNDCEYMKLNTLKKLYDCLKNEQPEIILDEKTIKNAKKPLLKMLEISALTKK